MALRWLRIAEEKAKIPHLPRSGWHMFQRAWATARKGYPLADLAAVGGWVDTTTVQRVYVVDAETTIAVVLKPAKVREV